LGNFPQAFTHLALINAVMHIIHAEEAAAAPMAPTHETARASLDARTPEPEMVPEAPLSTPLGVRAGDSGNGRPADRGTGDGG
jgi:hypothetical protein